MMRRLGNALCVLTLALLLGVAASRPGAAIEIIIHEPASSLRDELDSFAAAARARAAHAVERTGQKFTAFKALMRTEAEGFAAALRDGKTKFAALDWNAGADAANGKVGRRPGLRHDAPLGRRRARAHRRLDAAAGTSAAAERDPRLNPRPRLAKMLI